MAFPDPFTRDVAQALVHEAADSARINYKLHLFDRAELRRVDPLDVSRVLCRGKVVRDPVWNDDYRNWTVAVEGTSAGAVLRVIAAIDEDRNFFVLDVITVIVLKAER